MSDEQKIHNPILAGFNPDPSIVRVGDDYYIATSTFEWFPGVQVHHSRDLIHWRLLTRPLNRAAQLNMLGDPDSCGVWAPCLSYAEGLFWLIYTDVKRYGRTTVGGASGASLRDFHNFLVTSPRIDGEWSDPVYLNSSGFDPSLFHDDDGRKYFVNQLWDHRPGHNRFAGIILQEYSAKERKLVGESINIFKGTLLGFTEAPHLYKRGGWYYLITAEGGTGWGHAVTMARSRKITGPYELHPDTCILSARNRPDSVLQRAGHADLVETQNGETYMVYLCGRPLRNRGRCTLGRETAIQKMIWGQDGWLRTIDGQGIPTVETPAPKLPPHIFPTSPLREDFNSPQLPIEFQWLRTPRPEEILSLTARPGFLRLVGRETIGSLFRQSPVARRQQSHCLTAATVVEFEPQHFQQSAGLVCYYNSAKFHYLHISNDEKIGKHLRVMSCSPDSPQTDSFTPSIAIPAGRPVHLRVEIDYERLYFAYRVENVDKDWVWLMQIFDASILSDEATAPGQPNFTGAFIGMACQDMSGAALPADFDFFEYEERNYRENPFVISAAALKQTLLIIVLACWLGAFGILPSHGASIVPEAKTFIENHCADCHDSATKEAGLDLTALPFEPEDKANFATWVKVHDRVKAGEMPLKKKKTRPEPAALDSFVKSLASTLTTSEQAIIARDGRAMQRRLNRYEYENALRDLLGVPWTQLKNRLPEDGEAYRYNKSGEALDVSHVQMARYMSVSDYAMRQAISVQLEHPLTTTNRYYARNEPSLIANFRPRENGTLPDRFSFPVLDSHAQPDVRAGRAPISDPATKEREAVGKVSSIFSDAGGYSWGQFRAPVAGRYRLRFSGYSIWVSGGGIGRWFYEGQGEQKAPVYYLPLWHRPNLDEVWPGRRSEPIGVYAQSSGQSRPLGEFDFESEPSVHEIETILNANEVVQTDGQRLFRARVNGTDEQYVNPLAQKNGMPGYAVQWMEAEGPLYDESTGAGYRLLFGDLPLKRQDAGKNGVMVEISAPPSQFQNGPGPRGQGGARGGPGAGFGGRFAPRTRQVAVEVLSENPQADAGRLLRAFMKRAYRSPVEEAHVHRFLALFNDQFGKGFGFAKSMLSTYTAVLSSPGFIFTDEKPGRLDDYALASRLSFFLWNSEPDETLHALAARSELHQPEILRAQTDRLLNDSKSTRFVEAFTDYWLDLRKIDDTSPSTTLYNDYELDDPLKLAAIEETRLFVAELLRNDLPARNIVDSDFTFLNERLATHYGVPDVKGANMRKVTLPKDSVRGGLMTQASVLKVTANGTTTSPVLRGYWITERIMGRQIPPPPPVASVEPDIRGAVTLRQQLEKHRNNASCAACHSKMDPPGFALESFDVMGGWRNRYRAVKEGVKPESGFGLNGQAFAFYYALPVDCAGELPDGRTFKDVREFKRMLLQDEVSVARNLAKQLTIYATGAPVRFSDREQIEKIVQLATSRQFGARAIVHGIVQSELFQMK